MILTPEKRGSRKPLGEPLGYKDFKVVLSLLMRERGLKHILYLKTIVAFSVAPHAGAWIETSYVANGGRINGVAPHAGAWIETFLRGQRR